MIKVKYFDTEIIFLHCQNENLLGFRIVKKKPSEFELLAFHSNQKKEQFL